MKVAAANQTVYKGPVHLLISAQNIPFAPGEINTGNLEAVTGQRIINLETRHNGLTAGEKNLILSLLPPQGTHIIPTLRKFLVSETDIVVRPNENAISEQEYLVLANNAENPTEVYVLKRSSSDEKGFDVAYAFKEAGPAPSGSLQILFGFKVDKAALADDPRVEKLKQAVKERRRQSQVEYFKERDEKARRIDEIAKRTSVNEEVVTLPEVTTNRVPPTPSVSFVSSNDNGLNAARELLRILGYTRKTPAAFQAQASTIKIKPEHRNKVLAWINRNRGSELATELSNNPSLVIISKN